MTNIIFFGTPKYVVPVLNKLKQVGYEIAAVVTQPPRPVGRKRILTPSPVSRWAEERKIPILTDATTLSTTMIKQKADIGILAAYGEIISKQVLDTFLYGILNIHPSMLPKWRGPAPVEATIITGDTPGISIIKLDEEMDHGAIVQITKDKAQKEDTTGSLRERLFKRGAELLVSILPKYLQGQIELREQEHENATYTRRLNKQDGFIPPEYLARALRGETAKSKWKMEFMQNAGGKKYIVTPTPEIIERFIRAMMPWPGSWTLLRQDWKEQTKRLKILKAHLESGKLIPDIVQLEGKNPVPWNQLREGYKNLQWG